MSNIKENEAEMVANYEVESVVLDRYKQGAKEVQPSLCCPTSYNKEYLQKIPQEIIAKDYGCGDPTRYVKAGETVVDLGSGAGKHCYILAQIVGEQGKVIGVDFNDEMLSLARKYQEEMAAKIGYHNTQFVKGKIQDLGLSLDKVQAWLDQNPVQSIDGISALEAQCDHLRNEEPLISDNSVDVVISNCVLNLVRPQDKKQLFQEIYRVLKKGGRAVISDIVCDENPTPEMINDPELWSGCLSGAFREDTFLEMFEDAGFYGVELLVRQSEPWQVIGGIEFRSVTVQAFKGKEGPCLERKQAVIYKGPWKQVIDDDGHTLCRGKRMAVCDKTFSIYTDVNGPYHQDMIPLPPYQEIPFDEATNFNCNSKATRSPKETKGTNYTLTSLESSPCCDPGECC
ncbi:MAG: methyltransferase domain-containing protein [Cyanobacteria bacterium J06592_8]